MKADGDADRLKQDFCKQVDEAKEQCSFEAFQRSQAFYAPFREVHPFLPGKADKSELAKAGKAGRHMMVVAVIFVASGIILYISSQYFSRSQGFHGVSSIFNGNASPLCNILDGFSFSPLSKCLFGGYR